MSRHPHLIRDVKMGSMPRVPSVSANFAQRSQGYAACRIKSHPHQLVPASGPLLVEPEGVPKALQHHLGLGQTAQETQDKRAAVGNRVGWRSRMFCSTRTSGPSESAWALKIRREQPQPWTFLDTQPGQLILTKARRQQHHEHEDGIHERDSNRGHHGVLLPLVACSHATQSIYVG